MGLETFMRANDMNQGVSLGQQKTPARKKKRPAVFVSDSLDGESILVENVEDSLEGLYRYDLDFTDFQIPVWSYTARPVDDEE